MMNRLTPPMVVLVLLMLLGLLLTPLIAQDNTNATDLTAHEQAELAEQLQEFEAGLALVTVTLNEDGAVVGVSKVSEYRFLDEMREGFAKQEAALLALGSKVAEIEALLAANTSEEGTTKDAGSPGESGSGIDINAAGYDELLKVPGIGPVKAGAILAERDASGRGLFADWADLEARVPGIGPATIADMKAGGARIGAGATPSEDQSGATDPSGPMPIFVNRPDIYPDLQAQPIRMVTAWMIWRSADRDELPDETTYKALIAEQAAECARLVINVEHWETDARLLTPQELASNLDKLSKLLVWAKEAAPQADIGIYRMVPVRDYWTPVREEADQVEAWHEANARLDELAKLCDTIYPSIYAFYDRPAEWAVYARENLHQADRYGKPVMAFGHAQYHPSNAELKGEPLGGDFWALILDTSEAAGVAGFVIWAYPTTEPWAFDEPWLVATRNYLGQSGANQ